MPDFLTLNARGELQLTLPPADMFGVRWVGPETFAVGWGRLFADTDQADVIHMQHLFTAALVEAGYGDECATPETLARKGGAA
jgi:hypothetical protein